MSQEIFDQFCKDTKPILAQITSRGKATLKSCNADYYILDGADPGFSDPNKYKVSVVEIHENELDETLQLRKGRLISTKHFAMLSETDSLGNKDNKYGQYKHFLERYIEEELKKTEGEEQAEKDMIERARAIRDHFKKEESVPILAERFNNQQRHLQHAFTISYMFIDFEHAQLCCSTSGLQHLLHCVSTQNHACSTVMHACKGPNSSVVFLRC